MRRPSLPARRASRPRSGALGLALALACSSAASGGSDTTGRPSGSTAPRVIVSSDFPPLDVIPVKGCKDGPPERCSDPDDVQSMVRFLLYANDLEVEGLVASAGTFANVARKANILAILDLYDEVDENLRRHDRRYPTAETLRSVTWGWDPAKPGQQEGDTPSFLHLVSAVRGLNDAEKPDQGGWGGRFVRPDPARNHWFDDPAGPQTVARWRAQVQEEFALRADWMLP